MDVLFGFIGEEKLFEEDMIVVFWVGVMICNVLYLKEFLCCSYVDDFYMF